ncbi:MAG: RHS repeat-associated core domain-containing protein [Simkaniaceae bacterium]
MIKSSLLYKFINRRISIFLWIFSLLIPSSSDAISVKSYSYDPYGNLQEVTDPRGFAIQYHYDCLNRLEQIIFPDGKSVKYSYDLNGVRIKMEDQHGVTLFEPDEFGQINKVTLPNGQFISYQYDLEGNLVKLIYPDETEIEYSYDLSNRLETIKDFSGITRFEYDELSNILKRKNLPNGVTTEYRYHKTRRISHIIHRKANENLIEEFRYTYDDNGNRSKIEKITSEKCSYVIYTYDKLNRVKKAKYSDGFFEEFSYDGAGNRRSKTTPKGTIVYEYDEENRLRKAGDTTYKYDLAGNLIKKSSPGHKAIYSYNFDNHLISYSDSSNQVLFEYDGNGNRISKTVNGIRTDYINDLVASVSQVLLKQVQEDCWKGEKTTRYVYGGSRISQSADGKTQFYLYDSIGKNISALIGSSDQVLNRYEYDAFGGLLSDEQNIPNAYKYCGEQFDDETGLIFLRNRYYDPEIGRFISKDPRLGRLDRPVTLNPYLYVSNNPVNFIDPLGLEELTIFADFPNDWDWGDFGHGWNELKDQDGTCTCRGNYFDGPQNDTGRGTERTVSIKFEIQTEHATRVAEVLKDPGKYHLLKNNCIDMVTKVLDVCEIEHPNFKDFTKISQPTKLHRWITEQNNTKPTEPTSKPPIGMNFSPSLDFGGVSLSKTAELKLSLADIAGAAFDPATGQIVLFGPQNHYLPPLELDDLTVAVRSVYGIGLTSPVADPGVSIGTEPSPFLNKLKVRYDGATANTTFGQTIFEADYLLKSLMIGKDKNSGQRFNLNIPGYSSILARLAAHQCTDNPLDIRMWFVPEQITLVEDESHKGMVFSDFRMKVLTEAQFSGSTKDYSACREFAEHLTVHFDEFARQFPILEKLKQLGKVTAIVKWLKDNNVPFDTTFFSNYQPKIIETPQYITPIVDSYEWTLTKTEKRHVKEHRRKRNVPVSYPQVRSASGGISYSFNSQNFSTYIDPVANDFASSALKSRPSENDFTWTFSSPTNQDTFMAVAQSIYRTRKPGNVKKNYIDMSFSVPGNQKLSLQRFYNSFSEKESAVGHGWRITPYELELPSKKIIVTSSDGRSCETYQTILVRTPEGECLYQPFIFSEENYPLFTSSDYPGLLRDNLNGTLSLFISRIGQLDFDKQGQLLKTLDTNGLSIEYQYRDNQLSSIHHQSGVAIFLEYDNNRLVKASGLESTTIQYTYHPNGQLRTVGSENEIYFYYAYDLDKRLDKITDPLGKTLFEATYDDYNRAVAIRDGSMKYQADFSLEKKIMTMTDRQEKESIFYFDSKNRLIHKKSPTGLTWDFVYEQDNIRFPTKITDPKGNISECHCDARGNPIYFKNPVGAEWRFFYDRNGNLLCQKEPNGRAIWNTYGWNNRLSQTFIKATVNFDENDRYSSKCKGVTLDGRYAVSFRYNESTGQLMSHTNTRHATTSFTYDKNGQLKELLFPTGYMFERKVDEKGRIRETSDKFGIQKHYEYDGDLLKSIQTPIGTTHFSYHEGGDLKQITDAKNFATSYGYDPKHNLKEVTDAEGKTSSYEYNSFNQLIHISLPNGSCKTIEYDIASGRLIREVWGK